MDPVSVCAFFGDDAGGDFVSGSAGPGYADAYIRHIVYELLRFPLRRNWRFGRGIWGEGFILSCVYCSLPYGSQA
jgi:hypothetical protein